MEQYLYQLCLAIILGGIIGIEREWKGKSAGLQTYILVCLGASIFTLISSLYHVNLLIGEVSTDPLRVIQAVAIGIGFIGGGVIFFHKDRIEGLTTAAGLWVTAAVGTAIGCGFYLLAIYSTVLTVIILFVLGELERRVINPMRERKMNNKKYE